MLEKIVLLKWRDAHGVTQEWSEDDIEPLICYSIGYIETKEDFYIITPHYEPVTNQGCGKMAIPKVSVLEINVLMNGRKAS